MNIPAVLFVWRMYHKEGPRSTIAAISIMPTVCGTGCSTLFQKSAFLCVFNALSPCRVYLSSSLWTFRLLMWYAFRRNTQSSLSLWVSGSIVPDTPAEPSWGPLMYHRRRAESAMSRCAPDAEKPYGERLQSTCVDQTKKKKSYALQRTVVGRDVTVATLWLSELRGAHIWYVGALGSFAIYVACNGKRAPVKLILFSHESVIYQFLQCIRAVGPDREERMKSHEYRRNNVLER